MKPNIIVVAWKCCREERSLDRRLGLLRNLREKEKKRKIEQAERESSWCESAAEQSSHSTMYKAVPAVLAAPVSPRTSWTTSWLPAPKPTEKDSVKRPGRPYQTTTEKIHCGEL
jgi:hypothetical protein